MKTKWTWETDGPAQWHKEDSGCALVLGALGIDWDNPDVQDGDFIEIDPDSSRGDNGLGVRLTSWDDNKEHTEVQSFAGKRLKLTLEVID